MRFLWTSRRGCLSFQVLQEYFVTVTQELRPGLTREQAQVEVEDLMQWQPVSADPGLLRLGWSLQDEFALSFWDALIVAAAQVAGCGWLLTEDLQDSQTLGSLEVVNPFARSPHDLQ